MNSYQMNKEKARQEAINWQNNFDKHNYSWSELANWNGYFTYKAHKYGLVQEFRENGIIQNQRSGILPLLLICSCKLHNIMVK